MGIGGNAALAAGFAAGLVSLDLAAAAPAPPPKGFGALVDSGGKAALAGGLVARAGAALTAENGFLGGAALLEGVAFAAGGAGAFDQDLQTDARVFSCRVFGERNLARARQKNDLEDGDGQRATVEQFAGGQVATGGVVRGASLVCWAEDWNVLDTALRPSAHAAACNLRSGDRCDAMRRPAAAKKEEEGKKEKGGSCPKQN